MRSLGDGTFTADLSPDWTVGNRPHGGYLLALLGRTALQMASSVGGTDGPGEALDPLAVSAQFLRSPEIGPVLLRTELRKFGRTAAVIAVNLEQRGRSCVESMITVGRMAEDPAVWTDLPDLPAKPPADALDLASVPGANAFRLSRTCEVRLDQANTGFLHGRAGDPLRLRMWARPRGEHPDVLFGLVAGDISMPVTVNLGRFGWSPTVQVTALLRGRPAPGWLRIEVGCRAVHGHWFDEDAIVIDSAGRLVCQSRQLALTPMER
ncbi:MAG TPA: thioesterase family protein [Pseudonocardiaceae bacterium]|nr:thioesterase family protein [Pseudonocardiaceae bacterium]